MSQFAVEQQPNHTTPTRANRRAATVRAVAGTRFKPSGSLWVFWAVCFVTLIMSHYAISARLNLVYKMMTILVVLLAPLTTGFFNLFSQRAILWLLVYEAVLVVGCLTGYTGNPVDLLGVSAEPIVMVRVFPFLLCGFTLAVYPQVEKKWMLALVLGYALLTLPDALIFGSGSFAGVRRDRLLTDTYDEASARAVLSGYVNLSVLCLLVAISASRLRDLLTRFWRLVVLIAQGVLASVSLTSGFTAAVVLLLLSMAILGVTAPVRTLRFRLLVMGIAATVVLVFLIVVISVGQQKGGALGRVAIRLEGLRKAVSTREVTSETSDATSGRLALAAISVRSIARSPLIGLGKGKASSLGFANHDSDTHGGHSYLLDSLAKRGLLGTGPLLMALGTLLMTAYRNFRRAPGSWRESAMLTIMIVWIAAMIINPYFLGYISLNSFVFMLFGIILGDSRRLQAS